MAHGGLASLPGTDKHREWMLLPIPLLRASVQAGILEATTEGQEGPAAVLRSVQWPWLSRDSQVPGPAATAVCWAACRRQTCRASLPSSAAWARPLVCSLPSLHLSPQACSLCLRRPLFLSIFSSSASLRLSRTICFFHLTHLSLSYTVSSSCLSASFFLSV